MTYTILFYFILNLAFIFYLLELNIICLINTDFCQKVKNNIIKFQIFYQWMHKYVIIFMPYLNNKKYYTSLNTDWHQLNNCAEHNLQIY